MSDYPVGATWQGKEKHDFDNRNRTATIWLDDRRGTFEVWKYKSTYESGSTDEFGWALSYRAAKNSITFNCKMKRIK